MSLTCVVLELTQEQEPTLGRLSSWKDLILIHFAYLGARVSQGRAQNDLERAVHFMLAAKADRFSQSLRLTTDSDKGTLQQVRETRYRLHGDLLHVLPGPSILQHTENVVVSPGELLQLY